MQSADIQIAFDAAPIGLVLSEGRVIRACNEAFATLVGYSKNSLVGQSFRMFYGSDAEFEAIRDIGLTALQTRVRTAMNVSCYTRMVTRFGAVFVPAA